MDTDVLIVGAGPTGLMLANQLARRGIRVVIVDRNAHPARETRALGVQARTLEIYQKLGVVDRALALGKSAVGVNLWADGERKGRVPLGDAGKTLTPFWYVFILGQDDNERILGERLSGFGVDVQRDTELVAIEQDDTHVIATLKRADGSTTRISAAWLAGCDGAHSAVRTLNAIDFPGAAYEHVFFVADVEMTDSMVPDELNIYLWRSGFHLFFPMRGDNHWRIVGIVPPELRERRDLAFDDVASSVRGEAGHALRITRCSWFSTYRIHHRAAAHFRSGRCFVLGDAAHVHSPVGAQGMNTGLQDAYNLGWKLALVLAGKAGAALVDSYEAERLPVARALLRTTDRAFKLAVSDSAIAGIFRTEIFARIAAVVMRSRRIQHLAFRLVSQLRIAYRGGPISVDAEAMPHDAPRAGDRFPWLKLRASAGGAEVDLFATLDDLHFQLLLFGQPAPSLDSETTDLVEVHAFPPDDENAAALAGAAVPPLSFYLVRPDGYIGLCGRRFEPTLLQRYLKDTLGFT